jgi:5'-3' exonuclease
MPDVSIDLSEMYKRHGIVLGHKHLEADDIIYMVAKLSKAPLRIITNDKDILQVLSDDPSRRDGRLRHNIEVYDGGLKRIEGDPYVELWTKILCGDKSDNIGRLLTKKKAMAAMESGDLEEYKDTLNYRLINMDMVPAKYQKEFTKIFEKLAKN